MVSDTRDSPSSRDNFIERLYETNLSLLAESKLTLHDYLQPSRNIQMFGYSSFLVYFRSFDLCGLCCVKILFLQYKFCFKTENMDIT